MRRLTMLATACLLGAGCASTDAELHVPGTVVLKVGGSASIAGTPWSVKFDSVASDSRCPLGVLCIHAGEGLVSLELTSPVADPPRYDNPRFNLGTTPVTVEGYRFTQIELSPIQRQNTTIDPRSYVVTIMIESGTP